MCRRCGRTGLTARMAGHIGRGRCQGAELSLVSMDPPPEEVPPPPAPEPTVPAQPFTVPDPGPPLPPSVQPPPPPPAPEGPPVDAEFGDEGDEEGGDESDEDEIDTRVPVEAVVYRPPNPRGRPAAERPAGAGISDFWRPVQLTPETHVYYRMACTDPVFAERFGGLFVGSVAAFVDQMIHAFFVLNLRHGLGLAPLEPPADEDEEDERPLTARELRDLFAEMMGSDHSPEGHRARATQNAGAA